MLLLLVAGCGSKMETSAEMNAADMAVDNAVAGNASAPAGPPEPKLPCAVTGTRETASDCAEFARNLDGLKAGVDAFRPEQSMVRDQVAIVRYSLVALPEAIQGENGEIATASDAEAAADATDDAMTASDAAAPPDAASTPAALPSAAASRPSRAQIDRALAETTNRVAEQIVPNRQAGEVETHVVKLGQRMFACLSGDPSFTIGPAECQTYNLIETPNPVWIWQVTPTKAGTSLKLYLRSGIALEGADGKIRRIGRYATTKEIAVTVSPLGRFQDMLRAATDWLQSPMGIIAALTALLGAIAGLVAAYRKLRPGRPPKAP